MKPDDDQQMNDGAELPPVELPITGELDLHTFRPRDVASLLPEYLAQCRQRGIRRVRIIHGKGIGNLMRTVHSILSKHNQVLRYSLAGALHGGMGATIVVLRPKATRG